jgi:hypothetical protein
MFSKRSIVLGCALAVLLAACASEPGSRACTLVGCQTGYVIALQASQWPTGAYRVDIDADGRKIVCNASIPLPKGNPGNVCDAADVTLGLSGSELPVDSQSLSEVRFNGTLPKGVHVAVQRDSTVLADKTFVPAYKTSQPNGPDCEPTCTNDSAVLTW